MVNNNNSDSRERSNHKRFFIAVIFKQLNFQENTLTKNKIAVKTFPM